MRWPWPQDSREDRARRVAASYRRLCEDVLAGRYADPAKALADTDAHWVDLGQGWLVPTSAPLDLDDWVTPHQAEELFHVPARCFRDWARRGRIRVNVSDNGIRTYHVGDIVAYSAQRGKR